MARHRDHGPVDRAVERALFDLGCRLARLDDPFPGFDAWTVLLIGDCGWRSPEEAALEIAAEMAGGLADYLELPEQVAVAGSSERYHPVSRSLGQVLRGCREGTPGRSQAERVALLVDQLLVSALDQVVPGRDLLIHRAAEAYVRGLVAGMGHRPHELEQLGGSELAELRARERLLCAALRQRRLRHRQAIREQLGLRRRWSRGRTTAGLRELLPPDGGEEAPRLSVLAGSEGLLPAPGADPPRPRLRLIRGGR
jgi:hypothetical protein